MKSEESRAENFTEKPAFFEVSHVSKDFGGVRALFNVSFQAGERQIKSVVGPNGAGKTTLFNLISGFYPPSSGAILLRGRELVGLEPHEVATRGIGRTFQNLQLFRDMTVLENVLVGAHLKGKCGMVAQSLRSRACQREEAELRFHAMQQLELVGLGPLVWERAGSLSYGQQKLLEVARAVSSSPQLLLLDEPAAGLNDAESGALCECIFRIRERGIAVILVEHDMTTVIRVSEEIVVLDHGEKIAEGPPVEICRNPLVIEAYLGKKRDSC